MDLTQPTSRGNLSLMMRPQMTNGCMFVARYRHGSIEEHPTRHKLLGHLELALGLWLSQATDYPGAAGKAYQPPAGHKRRA